MARKIRVIATSGERMHVPPSQERQCWRVSFFLLIVARLPDGLGSGGRAFCYGLQSALPCFTWIFAKVKHFIITMTSMHEQFLVWSVSTFQKINPRMNQTAKQDISPISGAAETQLTVPALIGQVYEAAPLGLRASMLEHLLKPLGVLALVAVANGIFAKIRFRSGWPELHVRLEDATLVQPSDVIALADRVQQVSVEVIEGLARIIASSPIVSSSAAATLLMTVLLQRNGNRWPGDL